MAYVQVVVMEHEVIRVFNNHAEKTANSFYFYPQRWENLESIWITDILGHFGGKKNMISDVFAKMIS